MSRLTILTLLANQNRLRKEVGNYPCDESDFYRELPCLMDIYRSSGCDICPMDSFEPWDRIMQGLEDVVCLDSVL